MNYKAIISYDGTNFYGYQRQNDLRTVEKILLEKLMIILNEPIKIYASGRTDRGVHALNQVINFHSAKMIPPKNFKQALNKLLPKDIYIKEISIAATNFHARHSCYKKTYLYQINNSSFDVMRANYESFIPYPLDLSLMQEGAKLLIGYHDFKGFTTNDNPLPSFRHLYEIEISENKGYFTLTFTGNGFLKYMVRSMTGVLIEIGLKRKNVQVINEIFSERLRQKCGRIAEPQGLYLKEVFYSEEKENGKIERKADRSLSAHGRFFTGDCRGWKR